MKSEKRHEMQKNELAKWLDEQIAAVKPRAATILIGLILVVGAVIIGMSISGRGKAASASAWAQYLDAFANTNPQEVLENLAAKEGDNPVGLWALQSAADMDLTRGDMQLFRDRDEANKLLAKAEAAYKKVEAGATDPMLKNRARLGLGKVYESLDKPEDATRYYKLVAESEKDSAVGKAAAKAAGRMSDPRDRELLAWFATQKPRLPSPMSGPGGMMPNLPNDLPERPDLSLPDFSASGLNLDGIGTPKLAETPVDFPKPGENKPAESTTPEEAKPEVPTEKPADKPAEPKP